MLDGERVFARVVERGSLKAVAREMETDPATITRRLAALESRLGVKLLNRSRKGVSPTEAGARYYAAMRRLLPEIDAIEADITGSDAIPTGLVRLSCPVDFGSRYVTAWLADLRERHPALSFDLVLSDAMVDPTENDLDLSLRFGRLSDSALIARRVGAMRMILVGAARYLDRRGTPSTLDDLLDHEFVTYSWMRLGRLLTLADRDGARVAFEQRSDFTINNVGAIREAVLAGAGLHFGPEWLFGEDIAEGRLREVELDHVHPDVPAHLLYRPTPFLPRKTRETIDHLSACFRAVMGVVR